MDFLIAIVVSVVLIVAATVLMWLWTVFNSFATFRNEAFIHFSRLKAAQEKKLDMVEQLLGAVKEKTGSDKDILNEINGLRERSAMGGPGEVGRADKESMALAEKLLAMAEPDAALRSSTLVTNMERSIRELNTEIAGEKKEHDDMVRRYNALLVASPSGIIGELAGMHRLELIGTETPEPARPTG